MMIISESHVFYLNDFYTPFDHTTLYLQPNTTEKEMIHDIIDSANRNHVEVFTYTSSPRTTFLTEFDIYGTTGVQPYIKRHLNISEKKYKSLFLEDMVFHFHHLKNINGIDRFNPFYLIGSKKNIKQFKIDLIDKYAGNLPQDGFKSNELRNEALLIWLLVISVILLLTFYDCMLQKKENIIRFTLGEKISSMVWKNIVIDTCFYILLFLLVYFVLSKLTCVFFMFRLSLFMFMILLILNALIYFNLYFFNLKEAFSNARGSVKLLSMNYVLKLATTVMTIIIISSNIAVVYDAYQYYKQKPFFERHRDYYYTQLDYKITDNNSSSDNTLEKSASVQYKFYKQFYDKFNATLLADISNLLHYPGILANSNAFHYLSSQITELRDKPLKKEIYFIVPAKMKDNPHLIEQLKGHTQFYEGEEQKYDYGVLYYNEKTSLISIDENALYGSQLVHNPIIIYHNISPEKLKKEQEANVVSKLNYVHDIMYKISDKEFNTFVKNNHLTNEIVSKTNVMEKFEHNWKLIKRILIMNFIFSILVLLLEGMIIHTIIKLEYEVNAIEHALKKVFGYSLFQKNRKMILITFVTSLLSIITAATCAIVLNLGSIGYMIAGGVIILILELLLISFNIRRVENAKIQTILKGGNI